MQISQDQHNALSRRIQKAYQNENYVDKSESFSKQNGKLIANVTFFTKDGNLKSTLQYVEGKNDWMIIDDFND